RRVGSVDTRHLASEAASRVTECVNELADWARLHAAPVGADYLQYELTISGDERAPSRIVVLDDGKPDQRPMSLVNELVALASSA
ncbi:MAG TPA: hypothetical protein VHM25_26510, partial [Polyangiaceae bacterium]|nr:hypothetical protein [Polyangiaceae bacterium]